MKAKMKKALALALTAAMAISTMTACGTNNEESKTSSTTTKETTKTSEAVSSEVVEKEFTYPADTDTKLTWWTSLSTHVSKSYATLNEAPMTAALMEATGIEIEYIHPPQGQETEQLGILVGSGELPDLIETNWNNFSGGAANAIGDTIIDLTEAIDKWAPNLKKFLEENPEIDKQVKTDDGKYYCFPYIINEDKQLTFQTIMIRQDWLDELKLDTPTSIADWHDVLTKFKEVKGADTPFAPIAIFHQTVLGAWGVTIDFHVDDGKIVYGPYDARYKDALMTLAQWVDEGLFGSSVATMDAAAAQASLLNDETGVWIGSIGGQMGSFIPALEEKNPNAKLVAVPSMALNEGDTPQFGQRSNNFNGNGVAITTSCKDVEMAVRLLDYGYSEEGQMLYNFGIEGESYNMVGDYPTYTEEILHNSEGADKGTMLSRYTRAAYSGPFVHRAEYIEQYYEREEQKEALEIACANDMKNHILPPLSFTDAETAEITEIKNNITTYTEQMRLKFVTGVESFDKWDDYIKTLEGYGVKRIIEIYQAAYDRYMAK